MNGRLDRGPRKEVITNLEPRASNTCQTMTGNSRDLFLWEAEHSMETVTDQSKHKIFTPVSSSVTAISKTQLENSRKGFWWPNGLMAPSLEVHFALPLGYLLEHRKASALGCAGPSCFIEEISGALSPSVQPQLRLIVTVEWLRLRFSPSGGQWEGRLVPQDSASCLPWKQMKATVFNILSQTSLIPKLRVQEYNLRYCYGVAAWQCTFLSPIS